MGLGCQVLSPGIMRFASNAKALAKCMLKYYRISDCQGRAGRVSWPLTHEGGRTCLSSSAICHAAHTGSIELASVHARGGIVSVSYLQPELPEAHFLMLSHCHQECNRTSGQFHIFYKMHGSVDSSREQVPGVAHLLPRYGGSWIGKVCQNVCNVPLS